MTAIERLIVVRYDVRTMKHFAALLAFLLSTSVQGALPGVTEFRTSPEAITDAELSALLHLELAEADVVAIGESVHGSSMFLRIQTRLIRYLVVNHGFRLIAWENPTLRSLELSRWVTSCKHARTTVPIDVLYMPTQADLALWDWVCEYNRLHPDDPIVFRGTDVWDRPWEHYARLRSLAPRVGVDAGLLVTVARSCPAYRSSSWREVEVIYETLQRDGHADYERCHAALTSVLSEARRAGMSGKAANAANSDEAFELALSASTLLGWLGFYHYNWSDDILSWNARDRAQGENLALLMAQQGAARAILAAHTSHVSHNRSPADWWGYGDLKSGVYFFEGLTGKRVFNIALTAYHAAGTQGDWSLPTAVNSLDKTLQNSGHAFSFFRSTAQFLTAHTKWWMQNGNFPGPFESGVEIVPRDHFDAFIFFDRSPLEGSLPQRPIWQY